MAFSPPSEPPRRYDIFSHISHLVSLWWVTYLRIADWITPIKTISMIPLAETKAKSLIKVHIAMVTNACVDSCTNWPVRCSL